MSFPDSKRFSASLVNDAPTSSPTPTHPKNIPEKPRRKMSVFETSNVTTTSTKYRRSKTLFFVTNEEAE